MGFLGYLAYGAGGLGGLYMVALVFFQEKIVYVPSVPGMPREYPYNPSRFGLIYEDVELESSDDVKLHAWLCRPQRSPALRGPTILFFQENAGNIAHRLHNVTYITQHLQANVFIVSYRGYGQSTGTPSERGIKNDAQVALDYLASRADLDASKIIVFGRSLGGAVAAHLSATNPDKVRLCVLENTFVSIPAMAPCLFPLLGIFLGANWRPLNFLVRSPWKSIEHVPKLAMPTLYLSGGKDEMVPKSQMDELWEAGKDSCPQNERVVFPEGGHMDMYVQEQRYWSSFNEFMRKNGMYQ
mmetsp:Transcript_27858/g.33825  ORF Transcript_27858/g.33825 Transcript_27858/m.33825 type:complete len:298 (+) Transcript_27858:201-1094(+)|eukprot:CAMPEP_0197863622 /NCGR_PEP_ID=MMETSP1438-20131217/41213_1 /TAXON_ID=1461541 /ORGANISM="Pterosperma sp., Strain CCMP1384" /LENGTH=297 /DNA_ID=CAMNT_0043481581 /DNA_START=195 /DNA_END=1088 /DNA_ORIENTATION=-